MGSGAGHGSGGEFERVQRIDALAVVEAIALAGGPRLELRDPLGDGAVGAWLARWDGTRAS